MGTPRTTTPPPAASLDSRARPVQDSGTWIAGESGVTTNPPGGGGLSHGPAANPPEVHAGLFPDGRRGGGPLRDRAGHGRRGDGARGHALSVRHLRDPVLGVGAAPGALPDLRRRTTVRQSRGPEVDDDG